MGAELLVNIGIFTNTQWIASFVFKGADGLPEELPAGPWLAYCYDTKGELAFTFKSDSPGATDGTIDTSQRLQGQLGFTASVAAHAGVAAGQYDVQLQTADGIWQATGRLLVGRPGTKHSTFEFYQTKASSPTGELALPVIIGQQYPGLSAYQVALNEGFDGTVQEWMDSLVGADGADGAPGPASLAAMESFANPGTLTSSGGIVPLNWAEAINFSLTTTENFTLANPVNGVPGTFRHIDITQGATPRTITLGSQYRTPSNAGVALTQTAGAEDTLVIRCRSATKFDVFIQKDLRSA